MPLILSSVLIGGCIVLLAIGYYSFYVTVLMKRRSDAELFAFYPGVEQFYTQTEKEAHWLQSHDGLQLFAERYRQAKPTNKLVIFVHGYKNNRLASVQYVPLFLKLGYDVVTIDQRSHGKSEGRMATYSHLEKHDLKAWLDYFAPAYTQIGLHGHSMGGATVLAVADDPRVTFIISEAGLTLAAQGVLTHVQKRLKLPKWWSYVMLVVTNLYTVLFAKFSLLQTQPQAVAVASAVPLLVIHGTADEVVPYWLSQALVAKKTAGFNQLWTIEQGDHKQLYQQNPKAYAQVITTFCAQIENARQ